MCIKRPEQPLRLPASILIAADPEGVSLERFCSVDSEPLDLVPSAPAKSAVEVNACTWNGIFHSTSPFTFTLLSQPGTAVGDYVEVLRVYRNGDLMAAWNYASDQRRPDKVVVDGNHPLAGRALRFRCTVDGVRAATSEDIQHGHVHGAHGHHH